MWRKVLKKVARENTIITVTVEDRDSSDSVARRGRSDFLHDESLHVQTSLHVDSCRLCGLEKTVTGSCLNQMQAIRWLLSLSPRPNEGSSRPRWQRPIASATARSPGRSSDGLGGWQPEREQACPAGANFNGGCDSPSHCLWLPVCVIRLPIFRLLGGHSLSCRADTPGGPRHQSRQAAATQTRCPTHGPAEIANRPDEIR